jgi:Domain of unknown function (DUF3291)
MAHHLAQINVARMLWPLDDPRMGGFVAQLESLNALAEAAPGFVWRLQGAHGDSTDVRGFDDPVILVNMSVWESVTALQNYAYRSAHSGAVRDRKRWFAPYDGPYYALWWVPVGHVPSVEEGKARLELLAKNGPGPEAFWFGAVPESGPDGTQATVA